MFDSEEGTMEIKTHNVREERGEKKSHLTHMWVDA